MPALSAEELKATTRRYIDELYGKHNTNIVYELVAPDFVYRTARPPITPDREGLVQEAKLVFTAFPDARFTIDELLTEGETIVMRYTITGTHEGEFYGIAPTHKRMNVSGVAIAHTRDGKVTDTYRVEDDLLLMQQLGVMQIPQVAIPALAATAQKPFQG